MSKQLTYRSVRGIAGIIPLAFFALSLLGCNVFFSKTAQKSNNKTTNTDTAKQVVATQQPKPQHADTVAKKITTPAPQPQAPATEEDTNKHISPELAAILKQKGTPVKHASDDDLDVLKQQIIHTLDQKLDVTRTEIDATKMTSPVVHVHRVSDKTPNTQALPSAPTMLTNTMMSSSTSDNASSNVNPSSDVVNDSNSSSNDNTYNAAAQAQMNTQLNSQYTTSLLHDSVVATNNKDFLFNSLTITNNSSSKISLLVTVVIPSDWQLVTDKVITVTIEPNNSTIIPMRILPANSSNANWEPVRIEYMNQATGEKRNDFFNIKVMPFTKFQARMMNPNMVLPAFQRIINIPVFIKNLGNTPDVYTIAYKNDFFNLDGNLSIKLDGGRDTVYNLPITMTEKEYEVLTNEEIKMIVSSKGDAFNMSQNISKVGSMLKDHPSAFANMPLQVEVGAVAQGGTATQYYGALYGSVNLDDSNNKKVSIAYRSNTISSDQTLDNGLIRMDYTSRHVIASVGNIMEMTDFLMDGYGAKLGYNWGKFNDNKAVIYGMFKSRNGDSKVIGGNLQYGLANNVKLLESISTNVDNLTKLNSTIARQTINMKFAQNIKLALIAGVGMEQTKKQMLPGNDNTIIGSSFGYNFQYLSKHFSINSSVLYNSNSFAGVYKGQRLQSHDVRLIGKKMFIGGYYEYNFRTQNYFDDSVLLKDVFGVHTDNYGGRLGFATKGFNAVLSAGQQKQRQSGEAIDFQSVYNYLNLNTTFYPFKRVYINLNSYAGQGNIPGEDVKNLFITSNTGTISILNSGITFRYDNGPFYYSDFAQYLKDTMRTSRTLISPYIDQSFFKDALHLRAQYNYANTMPDNMTSQNLMLNIAYSNFRKGYDFHLTGTIPVDGNRDNSYLGASFRMRINAPCVVLRKYYRLRVVLYKDENSDGMRGLKEGPVVGQTVEINGRLLVSDADGIVEYRNIDKGTYMLNMGYSGKIRGWAPRNGVRQSAVVNGNTTIYIPYRKAKVLEGKLKVVADPNSDLKFNPGNIKVTVVSIDNNTKYSTLTNADGEFYFNLPSGHYTVTLSPLAFDEHFRPSEYSQRADMTENSSKTVYFEIRQKRREIIIHKE